MPLATGNLDGPTDQNRGDVGPVSAARRVHHKFAQHNHAQRRQSHQSSVTVATPLVEHRHPTVELAIELLADGQLPPCVRRTNVGVSTLSLPWPTPWLSPKLRPRKNSGFQQWFTGSPGRSLFLQAKWLTRA